MATQPDEPIGPFPPGIDSDEDRSAYDRLRRRVMWTFPTGLYLLGSRDGARLNAMTINWVTQVADEPKLVGAGVEKTAFTHELITAGQAFSVNVLSREDRAVVRKFVKPVDVDPDAKTLNGFGYRDGLSGAPILTMAAAWVDCRLHAAFDCGSHTFFVGEVVDAGFAADEDTPVLRMEDTRMNYGG